MRVARRAVHCGLSQLPLGVADGSSLGEEIPRWNEIGPRYGLQVVGPPIPADR